MHKIVLKVLALLVVGLLVTACEAGEKAPATGTPAAPSPIKLKTDHGVTDTEIKIGSTGGKSGGYTLGLPFQVGMESYFKKVNQEDGGVCVIARSASSGRTTRGRLLSPWTGQGSWWSRTTCWPSTHFAPLP